MRRCGWRTGSGGPGGGTGGPPAGSGGRVADHVDFFLLLLLRQFRALRPRVRLPFLRHEATRHAAIAKKRDGGGDGDSATATASSNRQGVEEESSGAGPVHIHTSSRAHKHMKERKNERQGDRQDRRRQAPKELTQQTKLNRPLVAFDALGTLPSLL